MPEKIHYDDNIFFLTSMIRALNDAVKLNVDAEYFADKILEDTLFIDISIGKIYGSIHENGHLIRRNSYLHSIMKLKKAYGRLLEDLLSTHGAFAAPFESMRPKLRRLAANHMDDVREIREGLNEVQEARSEGDVISHDELHYLMSPMDDSLEA